MKDRIILDLCGGTGSWSKPYKEAGYDVRLITLPDQDVRTYEPPLNVYGILAAPPCTEFSLAKNRAGNRNFDAGLETVFACLSIIWKCRKQKKLEFWALENPRGLLRQFIGMPSYEFQHWEFGDKGIKPTDLWGYFNEPRKRIKKRPSGLTKRFPNGKLNAINWSGNAEKRAITPQGFAKAFFEANR